MASGDRAQMPQERWLMRPHREVRSLLAELAQRGRKIQKFDTSSPAGLRGARRQMKTWHEECKVFLRNLTGTWEFEVPWDAPLTVFSDAGPQFEADIAELLRRLDSVSSQIDHHPGPDGTFPAVVDPSTVAPAVPMQSGLAKVFIVHGRDKTARLEVLDVLRKLGLDPVVLDADDDAGRTIIEDIEAKSDVAFAVVLLTPDDIGCLRKDLAWKASDTPEFRDVTGRMELRARENVILELGFFLGKYGRPKVCAIAKKGASVPSDFHGVKYVSLEDPKWEQKLVKRLRGAGLDVDANKL